MKKDILDLNLRMINAETLGEISERRIGDLEHKVDLIIMLLKKLAEDKWEKV